MSHKFSLSWLALLLLAFTLAEQPLRRVEINFPKNWPAPEYDFEEHPLLSEQIALGRRLFYDPILSKDSTVSCASCHLSYTAFAHTDHALSHGIYDSVGDRNAPALMNLAWNQHFMWDGAIMRLDAQALAPINDPREMGETTATVIAKLKRNSDYNRLFKAAFGKSPLTTAQLVTALAQFQLTILSCNAKYDRVMAEVDSFSAQEKAGYLLFQLKCNSCHTEPLFTNQGFENNGLLIDPLLGDVGRFKVTQQGADSLNFKVPSLRNIHFSKPYMHDGRFSTLRQVIRHYSQGPMNALCIKLPPSGLGFTPKEQTDLLAFLTTLNDSTFLFNPAFSFPKD